jgi:hypothetical protein
MQSGVRVAGIVVLGAAAAGVAAATVGSLLWSRATARAVARLTESGNGRPRAKPPADAVYSPDQLVGLPAPVIRYFNFALTPGQRLVRHAELRHAGHFAMRPGSWVPFTSTEHFVVHPPGFLWDASMRMGRLLPVRVHDSYMAGQGALRAAVLGLLPVADQHGTPEMAAGELLRYLAEAAWFPTALLPGGAVRWESMDDSTARAVLEDGAVRVSMDVHFGGLGEIARISAQRPRTVGRTTVPTPWVGRFGDYERIEGMRVPMTGEVGWRTPEGLIPYWRARVVAAKFDFAP